MSIKDFDCYSYLFPEEEFPEMHNVDNVQALIKNFENLKVSVLKKECKKRGIHGFTKMRKNEIIQLLKR